MLCKMLTFGEAVGPRAPGILFCNILESLRLFQFKGNKLGFSQREVGGCGRPVAWGPATQLCAPRLEWEASRPGSALSTSPAPARSRRRAVMPRAALSTLLLLSLGAAAVADCPSSTWVQFQGSCYTFLQITISVESIEDVRNQCIGHGADMISIHNEEENAFILDTLQKQWKGPDDLLLGMFYDTDDASFKWFDNSNMTFDKWADEDVEDLVDTCGFLYTKTGEWRKGNCEISSVVGALCKVANNHILITTLVIASTVTLTVLGAIIWFLYKRNACSGLTTFSTSPQSPYNDGCALVVADDDEYAFQLD
ncbi:CD302 antigen isoform X2 [Meriones unguiculatus]|uniref:CD302 antigen isoform X2 n=1 Tax=Meriones unguiculatus TaxID=10047 RepID=UPI001086A8C9|nr:CD302 antigen isoform X2 [Meriones unguiculatus]